MIAPRSFSRSMTRANSARVTSMRRDFGTGRTLRIRAGLRAIGKRLRAKAPEKYSGRNCDAMIFTRMVRKPRVSEPLPASWAVVPAPTLSIPNSRGEFAPYDKRPHAFRYENAKHRPNTHGAISFPLYDVAAQCDARVREKGLEFLYKRPLRR